MAVNAKFLADFTSFQEAVSKANVSLRSFETGAENVERSLNRMSNSFSGTKIIQDATLMAKAIEKAGGAATLTNKQLGSIAPTIAEASEKLRKLGQDVPESFTKITNAAKGVSGSLDTVLGALGPLAGAFGIAFSIGGVVAFTRSLVNAGSELANLSKATGISTTGLQQMAFVGAEAGLGLDELGRASSQLSDRLAGGDKSAVSAVQQLGLSVKALIAAGPQEAFLQIADAVGRLEDPMTKNAVAADLFGAKLGRVLIPLLGELRTKMNDVPKGAIISDENIKLADDFDKKIAQLTITLKAYATQLLGMTIPKGPSPWLKTAADNLLGPGNPLSGPGAGPASLISPAGADRGAISNAQLLANELKNLREQAMTPLSAATQKQINELREWGKSESEIATLVGASEVAVHAYAKAHDEAASKANKATEEFRKMAEAVNGAAFAMQRALDLQHTLTAFGFTPELEARSFNQALGAGGLAPDISQLRGFHFGGAAGSIDAHGATMPDVRGAAGGRGSVASAITLADTLDKLSASFTQLAQVTGGTMGQVERSIATITVAANIGADAGEGMKKSMHGGAQAVASFAANAMAAFAALMSATSSEHGALNIAGGAATGAQIGSAFGPWGAALGAGAGALFGWARNNTIESRMVSPGRDAFFQEHGGLQGVNEAVFAQTGSLAQVRKLFDAQNITQWNAALKAVTATLEDYDESMKDAAHDADLWAHRQQTIDSALSQYGDTVKRVDDLLKKYHFTPTEAGQVQNQMHTTAGAAGVLNDWQMLIGAGADPATLSVRMAAAFSKVTQAAIKTGTELPSSMKPVLEHLIELGLLTDDAGKALKDLTEVKFGQTLPESMATLTAAIERNTLALGYRPPVVPDPNAPHGPPSDPSRPPKPGDEPVPTVFAHSGGYFDPAGFKRMHVGGVLGANEVPFIGKIGEGVLNEQAMKLIGQSGLHAMNRGILPIPGPMTFPSGSQMGGQFPFPRPYQPMPPRSIPVPPPVVRGGGGSSSSSKTFPVHNTFNISAWDGASVMRALPQIADGLAQGGAPQTKMRGAVGNRRGDWRRR